MSVYLSPKTNLELEWPDYSFIAIILLLFVALSFYFNQNKKRARRDGNQLSEFLLATRNLSVLPAACSIGATLISALALTTFCGEFYYYGVQFVAFFASQAFGMNLVAFTVVPVYRKTQYISIFQLLEERFDSCIRRFFSIIFIVSKLPYMAVILYLPALSLTTLTSFNTQITTFVLGFVCTSYSSLGGFRTVVWTDAIQCVLIIIAPIMIIGQGSIQIHGGLGDLWRTSMENGYLKAIYWFEEDGVRFSIWGVIIYGLVVSFDNFLINQATLQRVLSVRTNFAAKGSVILASIFILLTGALIASASATLYALYGKCDPMIFPQFTGVSKNDQVFVYAIGDLFQNHVILKGVAVSGIISASLSTFSSYINSFAALALEDFLKPLFPNFTQSDSVSVKLCMALSFGFGAMATLLSLLIPLMGNVIKIVSITSGIFRGPLSGMAILVLFYKKITKKACVLGTLMSMLLVSWLTIGNAIYAKNKNFYSLTHSTEDCETEYGVTKLNKTMENDLETGGILMPFYKIPFMWYNPIGFATSIILGFALSEISTSFQGRNRKINSYVKERCEDDSNERETMDLTVL